MIPDVKFNSDGSTSTTSSESGPTLDDPFSDGLTGAEVMAEGAAPESIIHPSTNGPTIGGAFDSAEGAVSTMEAMAQDGDDANEGATFDSVPNTEEGRQTIRDSVATITEAVDGSSSEQADNSSNSGNGSQGPAWMALAKAMLPVLGLAAVVILI